MHDIIDHSATRIDARVRSDGTVHIRRHIAARHATLGASTTAARGFTSRLEDHHGAVRKDQVARTQWSEAMVHWLGADHP